MLAKLLCWLWVHSVTEKWFMQKNCVICFTKINSVSLHDLTSENIRHYVLAKFLFWFEVIFIVDLGYIFSLQSDSSRHTVLDISQNFITLFRYLTSVYGRHYVLAKLLCWNWVHSVTEKWFMQTNCVFFFIKIHELFFPNFFHNLTR